MTLSGFYIEVSLGEFNWGIDHVFEVGSFECPDSEMLRTVQGLVGGPIEAIPTTESISLFVNENGKDIDLPINEMANMFWKPFDKYGCLANGDWIAGTMVILGPTTKAGRTTSAPANTAELIEALCNP